MSLSPKASKVRAMQEIAKKITIVEEMADQINKAIQQLDLVIKQNSSTSKEMAATAKEPASRPEQLQTTIGFFKLPGIHTPVQELPENWRVGRKTNSVRTII